jgi:hypothetical protein
LLIAINYLSKKKYLRFKNKGVHIFLFNEIDFSTEEFKDDVFLNCNSEKLASTWFTWEENDQLLKKFKLKYPEFFFWKGYDMNLAFQKMLFWTNYKTGLLWYCKNKFYPNEPVYYIDSLHPYNKIKSIARFYKVKFTVRKNHDEQAYPIQQDKTSGLHIKDDFELGLYEYFIREIAPSRTYRLFFDKPVSDEKLRSLGVERQDVSQLHSSQVILDFPKINLAGIRGKEWYILTSLLRHWRITNDWICKAEQIAASGIRKIVVNEAENGIYGACMGEVMRHHGIKMYNTMNGLKAGQAQDAYINFHKWFVWDKQMKSMLMERCGLEKDRLVVSGHLMEDYTDNYHYGDSLGIDTDILKDKKVISVFSVRSKREAKILSLNYLYNLVKHDESLFLIVRPHPSEKPEDFVLPDFKSDRIRWITYDEKNSKTTLYDQIFISDVCVVYGSTVALECKWFGKKCITFELRSTSLLYFVDGKQTIHVDDMEKFRHELHTLLDSSKQTGFVKPASHVAKNMAIYLEQE